MAAQRDEHEHGGRHQHQHAERGGLAESEAADRLAARPAELAADVGANDSREDYLRATLTARPDRLPLVTPFPRQDSALLRLFAAAEALIVRPPSAPAAGAGSIVPILLLD